MPVMVEDSYNVLPPCNEILVSNKLSCAVQSNEANINLIDLYCATIGFLLTQHKKDSTPDVFVRLVCRRATKSLT